MPTAWRSVRRSATGSMRREPTTTAPTAISRVRPRSAATLTTRPPAAATSARRPRSHTPCSKPGATRTATTATATRPAAVGGVGITLTYGAENRLTGVSGSVTAGYAYDGDGQRVKATLGSGDAAVVTAYAGRLWEQTRVTRKRTTTAWRRAGRDQRHMDSHGRPLPAEQPIEQHQQLSGAGAERAALLSLGRDLYQQDERRAVPHGVGRDGGRARQQLSHLAGCDTRAALRERQRCGHGAGQLPGGERGRPDTQLRGAL